MKNNKFYGVPDRIWAKMFGVIIGLLFLTLCSCSSYRLATISDDMYPVDFTIPVSNETKIDTINSLFDLKYKLRTDFNFRWDFAQYAMQQPYSWYFNNPRLEGIWRPYNRFDVYFNSHWFWSDWAWGYNYYSWNSFYNWNRPWNRPWYYRPYNWGYSWYNGPWHNSGYNAIWNSSRENNVAYIRGRRGSNNIDINTNSNIQNTISRRYNNPRPNVSNNNNNLDNIVNILRDNYNVKPRVYNNPNNIPNNNNVKPNWNNSKPIYNNNSNININSSIRNNNSFSSPPPSSNISRGSSISSGGSSRGGNSKGRN